MKFVRPESYSKWTPEQTKDRIEFIAGEIKAFNQELNNLNSRMNELKNQKRIIGNKVGNKVKYMNQLKRQLFEFDEADEWKEL